MPDFDTLKAKRRDLAGRLSDNLAARDRLRQAEVEEAAILAEIGALGAREIQALSTWARSGGGVKPQPDVVARAALHERLVSAQLAAENARGASASLDEDQRTLASDLQAINREIDRRALDTLAHEHRESVEALSEWFASAVRPRVAHVLGLRALITGLAQEHQGSGRGDEAMMLFRRGEAIGEVRPDVEVNPLPVEVMKAASAWRTRLDELTGGKPTNVVPFSGAAA